MNRLLTAITTAVALAMSTSAHADARFLQAAALVIVGSVGGEYKALKGGNEVVEFPDLHALVFQDKNDPCVVHTISFNTETSGPLLSNEINFNRMPSPRAFNVQFVSGIGGSMVSYWVDLPKDAIRVTKVKQEADGDVSYPPTGKYIPRMSWADTNANGTGPRRLGALDYIRRNFCRGRPEQDGY
jgi:hypothetical protein